MARKIKHGKKVLVLGFDGLSADLLINYMSQGIMPAFKEFTRHSAFYTLKTVIPPSSPAIWTSIFTGVNPGKHAIFSFINPRPIPHPVTSRDRKAQPIWTLVSNYGKKVLVLNCPSTYPPDKVRGLMVAGFPILELEKAVYPPKSAKALKKVGYVIDIPEDAYYTAKDEKRFVKLCGDIMLTRAIIAKELLTKELYDLAIIIFTGIDRVSHYLIDNNSAMRYIYNIADKVLSIMLEDIEEIYNCIIVSDHGFYRVEKALYILPLLRKCGLMNYKLSRFSLVAKWLMPIYARRRLTMHVILRKFRKLIYSNMMTVGTKNIQWIQASWSLCLKRVKTASSYYPLLRKISSCIRYVYDHERQHHVIRSILTKDELFNGPYVDLAPDIFIIPNKGYTLVPLPTEPCDGILSRYFPPPFHGEHSLNSVLLVRIDGMDGKLYDKVSIYDIAPTILSLLRIPIPNHMDGRSMLKDLKT